MRELQDYPGYFISETGDVFDSAGEQRPVYLSGIPAYKYVNLPAPTKRGSQIRRVHILVAKAYIPNPDNLPMVNHIDEDKMNCHYTNLEWCTRQHNTLHSRGSRVKTYKPRVVYSEEERREHVARFRLTGGSKRKAYLALGISSLQFDSWLASY